MSKRNGKKPVRLTLTMIVRDCAETLEPLLASLRPYVDQYVIGLGGKSSDRTEQIARKYGDTVIDCGEFFPDDGMFDFASARQKLMPYVEGTYWCWFDGDDAVEGLENIPAILDSMDKNELGRVDMQYHYAFDDHGNLMLQHQRERILRTSLNWHWLDRVHETPHCDVGVLTAFSDDVLVIHKAENDARSSERNLAILNRMYEEDPKARTIAALANTYYSIGKFAESLRMWEEYLKAPEDIVGQWGAHCMGARCALRMDDLPKAQAWAMMAAGLLPVYEDAYVLLAQTAWYTDQDVAKTAHWIKVSKAAEPAPLVAFRMPMDNLTLRADVEHRVLASQKKWDEAALVCAKILEALPDNLEWKGFASFYAECQFAERSRTAALHLADHMVRHGDVVRAKGLLEHFLPSTIRDDPAIMGGRLRVNQFLNSVAPETYEDADHHEDEYDVEQWPRFQFYLERLRAAGAKKVLEVGCHIGQLSRKLAQLGFETVGIDFNPHVIELANKRAQEEGVSARFICAKLDEITEQFDAVLLAEILEHVTPSVQVQMLNKAEQLAPVVLGSVPAEPIGMCEGLFEKGRLGNDTFRPHIFEFDQNDLETLIATDPSREIVNCHKISLPQDDAAVLPGFGNRVFEFRQRQPSQGIGITFYLGPGWEHWTPHDIEAKGIGGSETAAVRLAEELAKRGHYVSIYGPETGVYNGVVYRRHELFDPDEARDVVVVSRLLRGITKRPNAKTVILWSHDISYGDALTEELANNVDKMVVMSDWQKEHWLETYPFLEGERIVPIGNAIKPYDVNVERLPHRFVYSSSPDRGLDDILFRWADIRAMWPDAELHIFYGWQYLDPVSELRPYKARVQQLMRQDGVHWHGRTGQKTLAEEFAKAQFWLYPSMLPRNADEEHGPDFYETFCITAVESQMYGCIPVTRMVGALSERLRYEAFLYPWTTAGILERLQEWDKTDMAVAHEKWRETAEQYTWHSVADQWLTLIAAELLEKYGEVEEGSVVGG